MRRKIDADGLVDFTRQWRGFWLLPLTLLAPQLASAQPTDGHVTAGTASITQSGGAVTVEQSSTRAAIDWQSFGIAAGESVTFLQPSEQSIALNRILGSDPSIIAGNLSANGQIFLLNPNGVLFGAGAKVDVGGILASSLELSNDDFMAGRFTLRGSGEEGSVVNQGTLQAADGGYVALAGPNVSNEGSIRARLGTVALGAGAEVTLNIDETQLVDFNVDKGAVAALASNRQLIQADGGSVILSARAKDALLSTVLNNDGIIEARSVSNTNGVIRLEGGTSGVVAVTGTLDASGNSAGETGGRIEVTGDKVALLDGAHIDVTGNSGGGTALIGGDYRGANPNVQNSARTFVASSAQVSADATDVGNGGRVVVWADGDTQFHGAISARGGEGASGGQSASGGQGGGDGGFVEVSGKQQLGFDGRVDTTAANGAIGTLLLDPDDLTIAAAPPGGGAIQDASNPFQATDGTNNYYVLGSTLTTLPAATAVQLLANHDIIFQTSLVMPTTTAGSITMNAGNAIQMGGFDLSTLNGSVAMTAGLGGIGGLGTIGLGTGTLTLSSSGAITQNAGDLIQGATALVKQGTGTLTLSNANTYTGATTVGAGTLAVTANNAFGTSAGGVSVASGATIDLQNVAYTTAETITLNGGTLAASTGTSAWTGNVTMTANSIVDVDGTQLTTSGVIGGATFGVDKRGTGALALSGANTYTGATLVNEGTLRLTATNRIADTSAVSVASGATFDLAGFSDAVGSIAGAGSITLGSATLTAGNGAATTFSGTLAGTGGFTKTGAGALTLSGTNTYTGTTTINGGVLRVASGSALLDSAPVVLANTAGVALDVTSNETIGNLSGGGTTGGNILLNANTLTVNEAGATTYTGVASGSGNLVKQGAGVLTLAGANTFTGATTINAGTVALSVSNVLANGSSVVVNGGTLSIANRSDTVAGVQLLAGSIAGTTGVLTSTADFDLQSGTVTAILGGAAGANKSTGGTVLLSGTNTYTGATSINDGIVRFTATNRIADASAVTVASGATLDLAGFSDTVGSIAGAGSIVLGTATLSAGGNGTSTSFSGILSGTGGLTKLGAGTLTLSGTNSYTGTTAINGGVLRTAGINALVDSAPVTLANTAGVALDLTNDETIGNLTGGGATGGNILLNANTLTVNEAGTTTFSGVASGSGNLVKQGAGTLTIGGVNTYTGTTFINAGTLALGANNVLADTSSVVVDTGTLSMGTRTDTVAAVQLLSGSVTGSGGVLTSTTDYDLQSGSVSAILGGTAGLNKSTGGTLLLSATNTYTGATSINDGIVRLTGTNRIADASAVTVASGATLDLAGFSDTVGSLAGGGSVTLGSATLTAGGNGTSTTYSGILSGTGGLTKLGGGTLTLSGANTYTGTTTINGGVLRTAGGNALVDSATVTLANVAGVALDLTNDEAIGNLSGGGTTGGNIQLNANTLTVNEAAATTFSGVASGSGNLVKQGTATLTLAGANTFTGTTRINAGTLAFGASNVLADASSLIVDTGTLALGTRSDSVAAVQLLSGAITSTSGVLTSTTDVAVQTGTITAILGGSAGLSKSTSGTLVLSGANTYTGATTIDEGIVQLTATNRIGNASAVTVASGATLDLAGFSDTVGSIAGGGSVTLGSATLTAGNNGTSTIFSGTLSGTGGLTKTGAGALTLSGANTYTGTTTISGGVLRTAGGNVLVDSAPVTLANTAGVALDLTNDETIGNLSGGGTTGGNILLNANTLTVNETGTTTFSGVASGSGNLVKQGAGTLTIAGGNTFTGITSINGGGLTLSGGATLPDSAVVDLNSGTLTVASAETIGRLNGADGTALVLPARLTLGDALDSTIASTVSGASGLTKRGTGTITLNRANTYAGTTNVNAGTLLVTNASALGTTAAGTVVANGGTLEIAGLAIGGEALTLNGTGVGGNGALVATGATSLDGPIAIVTASSVALMLGTDSLTFNGGVAGPGALSQIGAGTITFANSVGATTPLAAFTSAPGSTTHVNGGQLRTTGAQLYDGALTIAGAATLRTTNGAITVNSAAAASGPLTFTTGIGDVMLANPGNDFTTVAFASAGNVAVVDANALAIGTTNVVALNATTLAGDLTVDGAIVATGSGDSIVLASAANFINNVGPSALDSGAGRWLVWSADPALDLRGDLAYAFKQYDATFGVAAVAGAGDGFLYTLAPTVTFGLTGAVSRTYDGTDAALLAPENYVLSDAIDGDVLTLNAPTAARFDDRHAGTGKQVNVDNVAIAAATNGGAVVYGYRLLNTTAGANIGTVTPAALTIAATANTKTYDGTTSAVTAPGITGLVGGDTVTGAVQAYTDKNAGTGKTLSIVGYTVNDGNGGDNYTVSLSDAATGVIDPATLSGSIAAADRTYDGTNEAAIIARSLTGVIGTDSVAYVGGTATFADGNAGTGKLVTATDLALVGADAGNYTVNTTATTNANITPATLTYLADPVTLGRGTPLPTFTGTVSGFKGSDTLASATTGAMQFTTTAESSVQVGTYAIDGSGLAAHLGNYVFVQDPTNDDALLITPGSESLAEFIGAVSSAWQTEGACASLNGRAFCGERTDPHQVQWMAEGELIERDGSGIRLPAGAQEK